MHSIGVCPFRCVYLPSGVYNSPLCSWVDDEIGYRMRVAKGKV